MVVLVPPAWEGLVHSYMYTIHVYIKCVLAVLTVLMSAAAYGEHALVSVSNLQPASLQTLNMPTPLCLSQAMRSRLHRNPLLGPIHTLHVVEVVVVVVEVVVVVVVRVVVVVAVVVGARRLPRACKSQASLG